MRRPAPPAPCVWLGTLYTHLAARLALRLFQAGHISPGPRIIKATISFFMHTTPLSVLLKEIKFEVGTVAVMRARSLFWSPDDRTGYAYQLVPVLAPTGRFPYHSYDWCCNAIVSMDGRTWPEGLCSVHWIQVYCIVFGLYGVLKWEQMHRCHIPFNCLPRT